MPSVSIIVPVYGVEKHIERCACSLFEQTHKDIEYIFVNDCTLDNSITVLEQVITKHYPEKRNRIKIINKGKNEGLPMARKTGLAYAAGDYVLHVDSDDWLEPDMIGKLYAKAMIDDCDIVYCDFIRFAAPPHCSRAIQQHGLYGNAKGGDIEGGFKLPGAVECLEQTGQKRSV